MDIGTMFDSVLNWLPSLGPIVIILSIVGVLGAIAYYYIHFILPYNISVSLAHRHKNGHAFDSDVARIVYENEGERRVPIKLHYKGLELFSPVYWDHLYPSVKGGRHINVEVIGNIVRPVEYPLDNVDPAKLIDTKKGKIPANIIVFAEVMERLSNFYREDMKKANELYKDKNNNEFWRNLAVTLGSLGILAFLYIVVTHQLNDTVVAAMDQARNVANSLEPLGKAIIEYLKTQEGIQTLP